MRGIDILKALPEPSKEKTPPAIAGAYAARDKAIVDQVAAGEYQLDWYPLVLSNGSMTATVEVSNPLMLGREDPLHVSGSAQGQQRAADLLSASLLTSRVADLAHLAATTRVDPIMRGWWADGSMGFTSRMIEHALALRDTLRGRAFGLISSLGKDWILSARLNAQPATLAANYGAYAETAPLRGPGPRFAHVHQSIGIKHDGRHADYSQLWRFMRNLVVNGRPVSIESALGDAVLCALLSDEGPIVHARVATSPTTAAAPPAGGSNVPRTLRRGMTGDDVAAWQKVVGVLADGQFGAKTEEATKAFQASKGLTADGIVGLKTRAASAGSDPITKPDPPKPGAPAPKDESIAFVPAKWFRAVPGGRRVDLVVLHTAELPEKATSAESVAAYFKNPQRKNSAGAIVDVQASAHYTVDVDSVVQSVHENDIAFAAPGANNNGVQIEMAGYAKQSPEDWADAYSDGMLRRVAALTADICRRYTIPMVFVDAAGLLKGERGITTHVAASKAFKKSHHTDPGPNFPYERFIAYVRAS